MTDYDTNEIFNVLMNEEDLCSSALSMAVHGPDQFEGWVRLIIMEGPVWSVDADRINYPKLHADVARMG